VVIPRGGAPAVIPREGLVWTTTRGEGVGERSVVTERITQRVTTRAGGLGLRKLRGAQAGFRGARAGPRAPGAGHRVQDSGSKVRFYNI